MGIPPVLMIVFNRPNHAKKVFEKVREVKPDKLYIAVDGPREGNKYDTDNIEKTLKVFEAIDWPCNVQKLVRQKNLGCKVAVSSAITWFFENEEQGIILEDDCLPSNSFFNYCHHLLEKYKDNPSVMHINGVNFQDGAARGEYTYYFSKICHVWGWASWRRAWQHYDITMQGVEDFFAGGFHKGILDYPTGGDYWKGAFLKTKNGLIDTWDYQWVYTVWKNNGLSVAPNYNLVSNIGFDDMATHTKFVDDKVSNKQTHELANGITDCPFLVANHDGDYYSFVKLFTVKTISLTTKIKRKMKKVLFSEHP